MTQSELLTIMLGGFATIAGSVLAGYIRMGIDATHLIAASVMSAPAALVMGKIIFPETEESETSGEVEIPHQPESVNLIDQQPDIAQRMIAALKQWNASVDASIAGTDYPEGKVVPADPGPRTWMTLEEYKPYLEGWQNRPEFKRYIKLD